MQIHQINPELRREVDRFVNFPFHLYEGCAQWVPPLLSEARANLKDHPFYEHSIAAFFTVESSSFRSSEVLGRITVMDNRRYNQFTHNNTAFFGFFETIDDTKVVQNLFDAAITWARSRNLDRMIGPRGLIGSDGSGVLVEGFEHRPALNIPYNYEYYDRHLSQIGFQKDTDHLSGYLSAKHILPDRLYDIAAKVKARRGFTVKSFSTLKEIRQWVPKAVHVHSAAFANTHTYYPPTERELNSVINSILSVADPRLIKLVLKDEQVVGFIIAYPDISAAFQAARGRLLPFGWYALLTERKRTRWVNVNGLGMLPTYQGLGGNLLLYTELEKSIKNSQYEHIEAVMVNEKNFASRSDNETIGVHWYKKHRSYWKNL